MLLVGSFNPSETYEFVSWDDDYSQPDGKIIIHVPKHQPDENWGVIAFSRFLQLIIMMLDVADGFMMGISSVGFAFGTVVTNGISKEFWAKLDIEK